MFPLANFIPYHLKNTLLTRAPLDFAESHSNPHYSAAETVFDEQPVHNLREVGLWIFKYMKMFLSVYNQFRLNINRDN